MKDIITRKYRLVVKTIGYIGWSLFWLLIRDVLMAFIPPAEFERRNRSNNDQART